MFNTSAYALMAMFFFMPVVFGQTGKKNTVSCIDVREKIMSHGLKAKVYLHNTQLSDATKSFDSHITFGLRLDVLSACEPANGSPRKYDYFKISRDVTIKDGPGNGYLGQFSADGFVLVPTYDDSLKIEFNWLGGIGDTGALLHTYVPALATLLQHSDFDTFESQDGSIFPHLFRLHFMGPGQSTSTWGHNIGIGSRLGQLYQIAVKAFDLTIAN